MGPFDKVIGYSAIKKRLERTADALANTEAYAALGVKPPRALLLYGDPGVGKTLMARCLIEASGREAVLCRKDEPNGEFVHVIKQRFEEAVEKAPSVLLLDDLDKFANVDDRHRDAEEYVTVQSCIDELAQGGAEVFVLATANDLGHLPHSLLRTGRLGDRVEVDCPTGADAEAILSHYLTGKKVVEDIDPAFLARVMIGHSCATLEAVVNEAGLLAGYERSEIITADHFMRALFQKAFFVPEPGDSGALLGGEAERTAVHEAGHIVVSEALDPGSVTLSTVYEGRVSNSGGFTLIRRLAGTGKTEKRQIEVLVTLGSKAALEQKYGTFDISVEQDLFRAFNIVNGFVSDSCCCGLGLYSYCDDSEDLKSRIEQATASEMERYYRKTKAILSANAALLDALAAALLEKGLLTMADISEIVGSCGIVPATL